MTELLTVPDHCLCLPDDMMMYAYMPDTVINLDVLPDIRTWCEDNLGGQWSVFDALVDEYSGDILIGVIAFEDAADMILFKLRWL